jgi:hypothetical protein
VACGCHRPGQLLATVVFRHSRHHTSNTPVSPTVVDRNPRVSLPRRGVLSRPSASVTSLPPQVGRHSTFPAEPQLLSPPALWFRESVSPNVKVPLKTFPLLYCSSLVGLADGCRQALPRTSHASNGRIRYASSSRLTLGPIVTPSSPPTVGRDTDLSRSCLPHGGCTALFQFQLRQLCALARR